MKKKCGVLCAAIAVIPTTLLFFALGCSSGNHPSETVAPNQLQNSSDTVAMTTEHPAQTVIPMETEQREADGSASTEADYEVLTIRSETYSDATYLKEYDIGEKVIFTIDEKKIGDTGTIEFAGHKYELRYEQTRTQTIGNYTSDEYVALIDGAEDKDNLNMVDILPDGTLISVCCFPIMTLKLEGNANGEAVSAAFEEAFSGEVDFGAFECCEIAELDYGDVKKYEITWYNQKNGIKLDDYFNVLIRQDGGVEALLMKNRCVFDLDTVPDDIRLETYIHAAELKLKEIYGDSLIDYELMSQFTKITNIKGSPCLNIRFSVHHYTEENQTGTDVSDLCELAVVIKP